MNGLLKNCNFVLDFENLSDHSYFKSIILKNGGVIHNQIKQETTAILCKDKPYNIDLFTEAKLKEKPLITTTLLREIITRNKKLDQWVLMNNSLNEIEKEKAQKIWQESIPHLTDTIQNILYLSCGLDSSISNFEDFLNQNLNYNWKIYRDFLYEKEMKKNFIENQKEEDCNLEKEDKRLSLSSNSSSSDSDYQYLWEDEKPITTILDPLKEFIEKFNINSIRFKLTESVEDNSNKIENIFTEPNLKYNTLNLSLPSLFSTDVFQLLQIIGPQLKQIEVENLWDCETLLKHCTNLTHLSIKGECEIDDDLLIQNIQKNKLLQSLCIDCEEDTYIYTSQFWSALADCLELKHLNIKDHDEEGILNKIKDIMSLESFEATCDFYASENDTIPSFLKDVSFNWSADFLFVSKFFKYHKFSNLRSLGITGPITDLELSEVLQGDKLSSVHLKGCSLTYLQLRSIVPLFKNLDNLKDLNLADNQLCYKAVDILSEWLNQNNKLESLSLAGNPIKLAGARNLKELIKKNSHLITLDIQLCRISDQGGQAIAYALSHNSTLTQLDISKNGLSVSTIVDILKSKSLITLNVSDNLVIADYEFRDIENMILINKKLKSLFLRGNHKIETTELFYLESPLTCLDLTGNNIVMDPSKGLKKLGIEISPSQFQNMIRYFEDTNINHFMITIDHSEIPN